MNWYIEVLKKYTVFTGRATRTEYWMFFLVSTLISLALNILNVDILASLYILAVLLPSIGVAMRRLHDTNRSGWWLFIGLIPLIGVIILIVFLAQESQSGSNQYGPNPKDIPNTDSDESGPVMTQTVSETLTETEEVIINEDVTPPKNEIVESHESLKDKN